MPVSPTDVEHLARVIADDYAAAEVEALRIIKRTLLAGTGDRASQAYWQDRALESRRVQAAIAAALAKRRTRLGQVIEDLVDQAYRAGANAAGKDLPPLSARRAAAALDDLTAVPSFNAVLALRTELETKVVGTHLRILTTAGAMYRQTVAAAAVPVLTGTATRLDAAQQVISRLSARGVTGYVDRAGRTWDLATYAETATRTATAQAAVQGAIDTYQRDGHDLVIVNDAPEECELCRPFEGQVLSLGRTPVGTLLPDGAVVLDTLAAARDQGLFHPNCRHNVTRYIPGLTGRSTRETADPAGAAARARQRTLERSKRAILRQQETAFTDTEQQRLTARLGVINGALAANADDNGIVRKRNRESLVQAR